MDKGVQWKHNKKRKRAAVARVSEKGLDNLMDTVQELQQENLQLKRQLELESMAVQCLQDTVERYGGYNKDLIRHAKREHNKGFAWGVGSATVGFLIGTLLPKLF